MNRALLFTYYCCCCCSGAAAAAPANDTMVELWLIPHTHADVGWLQTVDSLSRMNVSRILDGVTANLMNDTRKRRRFVWDEMAFLQLWWDEQATDAQKAGFKTLVAEGRIEFADNGWSQHDMGCTTTDSMLSNWVEGHLWLKEHFGEGAQPRVGWSLDPFGMSATQAVLQALMGMDAWFFTRLTDTVVADMKKSKGLEFVWRGSSALPAAQSEIFAHVFESYYCMPLPTYAFEWGADKGAATVTAATVNKLAHDLADIAKQRAAWFRTPNVLIPWGCDYQYQNAALMYDSTDALLDEIAAHPEWGVAARYGTPSEYLASVRRDALAAGTAFPVKANGTHFFPFSDWSGYFTSRSNLKGHSRQAEALLHAAEALFALQGPQADSSSGGAGGAAALWWSLLETARRNNGIVQHHDAITGTECANEEGCAGTDQVVGAHNVLADYDGMLTQSMASSAQVIGATLGAAANGGAALTVDPAALGDVLMGQGDGGEDALLVVYNALGSARTEMVTVPVPVCAMEVLDAETGEPVLSQVTALFGIGDGQAPFYDFELQFQATDLPPLGFRRFRLRPAPDAACGGGDDAATRSSAAHFVSHEQRVPAPLSAAAPRALIVAEAIRRQGAVSGDPARWNRILAEVTATMGSDGSMPAPPALAAATAAAAAAAAAPAAPAVGDMPKNHLVQMSNKFMTVYVDLLHGVRAVLDKASGTNHSVADVMVEYKTNKCGGAGDAYLFCPQGEATPLLGPGTPSLGCTSWRQTAKCDPNGAHQPLHDADCGTAVAGKQSGWCECSGGVERRRVGCDLSRADFTCADVCAASSAATVARAATVAFGPVMHEVRLQISDEHKTRIRLWQSDDPAVGGRLEFAHRIGVLEPRTEVATRWVLGDGAAADAAGDSYVLFSEDNGYEKIPHRAGTGADRIPQNVFPSQMSAFVANGGTMLAVALDRSHGVASLQNGTLEVIQHRRAGPYEGSGGTVVMDDTSRIFTQSWMAVGARQDANRQRVAMRQRLNHPLVLASAKFNATAAAAAATAAAPLGVTALPENVHLQSVRATSAANDALLVRLQHLYTDGEDAAMSLPLTVDPLALLQPARADLAAAAEVTLDGMRAVATLANRTRFPAEGGEEQRGVAPAPVPAAAAAVPVGPFELRTFRLTAA